MLVARVYLIYSNTMDRTLAFLLEADKFKSCFRFPMCNALLVLPYLIILWSP